MRTLVDIPEPDVKALDQLARRRRTSRAKVIRQAVSNYLAEHGAPNADEAYGLWGDREIDGLEYQVRIRSEW